MAHKTSSFSGRLARRVAALLALSFASLTALADPAHYFVVKEALDGGLTVLSHQIVEMAATPESSGQAVTPSRQESRLLVSMADKRSGDTVFSSTVSTSMWTRSEFHGADAIDGQTVPVTDRVYVVRLPVQANRTLDLRSLRSQEGSATYQRDSLPGGAAASLSIDLDQYAPSPANLVAPLPAGQATGSILSTGSPANRLDILIVGDGYTAAQQSLFVQNATTLANGVLAVSPYNDFRHLINFNYLFVPSNQSGADKPSCAETPTAAVVLVDTAFDGRFCNGGLRRGVVVDNTKVFNAAAAVADWDKIFVLVNDSEYGGTGGAIAVGTTHALSAEIMQHEFGHMFTQLADEYDSAFPGYPTCSDLSGSAPCEANVSNQTSRSLLKWRGWLDSATAIPTLSPLADERATGLWLGARYQTSGMYRQCFNGLMRALGGRPFCHVDSEAFVMRLYGTSTFNSAWGVPAAGLSLIEPGATPSASSLSGTVGSATTFQATVTGSKASGALRTAWRVNGVQVASGTPAAGATESYSFTPPAAGSYTVELTVTDANGFLLTPKQSVRSWTVQATGNSCSYSLSRSSIIGDATGGSFTLGVTTGAGCTWSAASNTAWLSVTSGTSGSGSGSVQVLVAPNSITSSRSGSLTVAGINFPVTIRAANAVVSSSANESITGTAGRTNTVIFSGNAAQYAISVDAFGVVRVADSVGGRNGTDTLSNIQRLEFADQNIALDTASATSAGGIYRIYAAAFNRVPDLAGLGYWVLQADLGQSGTSIATGFSYSQEFQTLYKVSITDNYGTGANTTNIVTGFYTNVLHRTPDPAGLAFYVGQITTHSKTIGQVLAEIADSSENRAQVAAQIANGIAYTPWHTTD